MRIIRNAVLVIAAATFLPIGGFAQRASTVVLDVQHRLQQLTQAPADGSQPSDFHEHDVRIRAEANTASEVRGHGSPGDGVTVDRPFTGETVTCPDGRSTAEWLHITDHRTRADGYVSRCFL
jgi:hypothetical protein